MNEQTPQIPHLPKGFLLLVALVLLANRITFHLFASPLPDEAYYWLWGQHPDWSYFDHPPLQAWLQAISARFFGDSLFALRIPSLLTSLVLIATILRWTRNRSPLERLTAILVVFASPLFFIFTTMVFNDHLLIVLLSLAGIFVYKTFDKVSAEGRVAKAPLYTAALLIGLAGLTKYNAALFAIGVGASVIIVPRFRPLLRSVHLYLAGLLTLFCLTPVFIWNRAHGAASFRYNLSDRLESAPDIGQILGQIAGFLLVFSIIASPFLIIAMWRLMRLGGLRNWRPLALVTFATSTLGCVVLAGFTHVLYYWNIMALIAFLPLAAFYFRRWQLMTHLIFGVVISTAFTINYTVIPLSALFGKADFESSMTYGWPEVAMHARDLQTEHNAPLLVASDYRNGAILAFWTPSHQVEVISSRNSEFNFWKTPELKTAIIVTDDWHPLSDEIQQSFNSITPLGDFPVMQIGKALITYHYYLGERETIQ